MANTTRLQLASNLGQSFDGNRDVYLSAGYPQSVTIEKLFGKATRQDIAKRIIDIFPSETWRKPPQVLDGVDEKTAQNDTDFVKAWNAIANPPPTFDVLTEKRSIWQDLQRADKLALLGQYGVLFIGVSGKDKLSEALGTGLNFAYLRPFSERRADFTNMDLETRTENPRYGMPKRYELQFTESVSQPVHWSRCIHIAEHLLDDNVYGHPLLESVYNRLEDLDQVLAGSKEAFWRLSQKGLLIETKDGYTKGDPVSEDDLRNFINGLTRTLELDGQTANVLGGESVDPGPMVQTLMMIIASSLGIPQKKLMGAQTGALSSAETDDDDWLDTIRSRQTLFAQPSILEPLINRLIYCGALPMPKSGNYFIKWPSLTETTASEDAQNFANVAKGMRDYTESQADRFVESGSLIRTFLPTLDTADIRDEPLPAAQPEISANVRSSLIPAVPTVVRITDDDVDDALEAWDFSQEPENQHYLDAEVEE